MTRATALEFGVTVPATAQIDFAAVMERMRGMRARISAHDSARRFRELGVDVFLGDARFTGPDTLEVDGETLAFQQAVIATGARARRRRRFPAWPTPAILTNENVFTLTELPRRLAVIGAGPHRLRAGAGVLPLRQPSHIAQRRCRDPAEAKNATRRSCCPTLMRATDGVTLDHRRADSNVRAENGANRARAVNQRRTAHGRGRAILVGVGRAPNVEGLGLEAAGCRVRPGAASGRATSCRPQSAHLRRRRRCLATTSSPTPPTHRRASSSRNALFLGREKVSALTCPWCTYTDPEIAHVGLYVKQAHERGIRGRRPYRADRTTSIARSPTARRKGFAKIHVKGGTDQILGATIVARHAGEMIGEITLAMVAEELACARWRTSSTRIRPRPRRSQKAAMPITAPG